MINVIVETVFAFFDGHLISMYDRGVSEDLSLIKKINEHNENHEKFFKYFIKELLCKKISPFDSKYPSLYAF